MPEADHDAVPLWRYVRAAKFHARDASATGTSDAEGRRGNAGVPERSSRIGTPRAIARANAQGFKRLANAITRDAIGIPLTRKQRAEIKAQSPKLDLIEVDKKIYRTPVFRQRSPREMRNRRKPGWTDCRFVLPKLVLEGLRHLAKTVADQERRDRSSAAHGFRRRYPRTVSFYLTEALNDLLDKYDLAEFCVQEAEPEPGRVRRFAVTTD